MGTTSSASRTLPWWLIVVGSFLGVICSCALCVSGAGVTLLTPIVVAVRGIQAEARPAQEAAEQFLSALRDADWESAYAWCAPRFQEELGGPDRLARNYGGALQPARWSFHGWSIRNEGGVRHAQLEGTLVVVSGETRPFQIELLTVRAGSEEMWRVSAFRIE